MAQPRDLKLECTSRQLELLLELLPHNWATSQREQVELAS